jgi:glutaredoxin
MGEWIHVPELHFRPFMVVLRHTGATACKHCAMALTIGNSLASKYGIEFDTLYYEDNNDSRLRIMKYIFGNKIPTPIVYYKGWLHVGAITPYHLLGMLEGLLSELT